MHEKNLEQTQNQIIQLEQHVYSIEAANINQETLNAMKNAGTAMKRIHGNLTMDKVDNIMYAHVPQAPTRPTLTRAGRISRSRARWRRKSATPSQTGRRPASRSTRTS